MKNQFKKFIALFWGFIILSTVFGFTAANAESIITLPKLISDNMLIQREKPIKIWGSGGDIGKDVRAIMKNSSNIEVNSGKGTVASDGKWSFFLPAMPAGGPYTLVISSSGTPDMTVSNVLIGELWVISGQSNMNFPVKNLKEVHIRDVIPTETIEDIRLFKSTATKGTTVLEDDIDGSWEVATPFFVSDFSAVGYCALKEMYDQLSVPVGGIHSALDGSNMAMWQGPNVIGEVGAPNYNGKIYPLTKANIRGIMWYQGESDRNNTNFLGDFKNLITSWRLGWNDENMPFLFVQLPISPMLINDGYGARDYSIARMRQLETYYTTNNVGMAVSIDCQPEKSIGDDPLHPSNKKPVGQRLAYIAMALVYGKDIPYIGPMYNGMSISGDTVTLTFNYTGDGLKTTDNQAPRCFKIAGDDGVFYDTIATITSKNQITLRSDSVLNPVKVYYCYDNQYAQPTDQYIYAKVNLINSAGLPASPFVTDTDIVPKASITDTQGNLVSGLQPSPVVRASVTISNQNLVAKNAILVFALYNSKGILVDISFAKTEIPLNKVETLKADIDFSTRINDDYSVMAFVLGEEDVLNEYGQPLFVTQKIIKK